MNPARNYAIIGATGGLGSSLARRLAATGARLHLAGRQAERLREIGAATGGETSILDATDFERTEEFLQSAAADQQLDGVVNCAGSLLLKPAHLTSVEEFGRVVDANLKTAFSAVRAGAKVLRRKGGSIVLVSSAAADLGLQNHEAIAAAKAGVAGLARSAAATYAARGIRVNAIAPGMVETPMTAEIVDNPAANAASVALHPLGRSGQPDEVSGLIEWLLGPDAEWVTGQVWGIDGGLASLKLRQVTRL